MSTVIRKGTIVTHDLTDGTDVRAADRMIVEIGKRRRGGGSCGATGCFRTPGEIAPHTRLEMPFTGTCPAGAFASGTRAALAGATRMLVGVAPPSPGLELLDALQIWADKVPRARCDDAFFMSVGWRGIPASGA